MERGLNPIVWLFRCWAICSTPVLAAQQGPVQAILSADAAKIVIGAPLNLTFRTRLPDSYKVGAPDTLGFAAAGIEALELPRPFKDPAAPAPETAYQLPVTAYDSGWYLVPPLRAVVQLPDGRQTEAVSPALRFRADYPASAGRDTVQLSPNLPNREAYPMTLAERLAQRWPLYAAILASCAIAGLVWWLRKKKLRAAAAPVITVVREQRSPYAKALSKLQDLRTAGDWNKGKVQAHYMQLSLILREYLEARFEVPALESTTDQLPGLLTPVGVSKERLEELLAFARSADLVKFAKFAPDVLECTNALEKVQRLIEHLEAESAPAASASDA